MKVMLVLSLTLFLLPQSISARQKLGISEVDRTRLAEAFRISAALGNRVWRDWDKTPFSVLLVTPENEFLIRHPRPPQDFTHVGYDPLLQSDIYSRKGKQNPAFLATFPVGGVPTIVIGQAENTAKKTSTQWVVTMFHEHFHQLQYSQPNYYAGAEALNLSRGDQTGMWMLNYAFPYATPAVKQQFAILSRLLAEAIRAKRKAEFTSKLSAYLAARRRFANMLSADDYRYFSFQVWQEGVARYTEYRVAELAAKNYKPSKAFLALKDYKSFRSVADEIMNDTLKELTTLQLDSYERVAFYPLGAGEALLLHRMNAKWQNRYFTDKFSMDKYFDAVR